MTFYCLPPPITNYRTERGGREEETLTKMVANSETASVFNFRRFWTRVLSNAPRKDRRSWSSVTLLNFWHFGIKSIINRKDGQGTIRLLRHHVCPPVFQLSLHFRMFLLKFNKRLWQFQASCNVVCDYDGQVVKVIICSRRNGHFPVIVLCTLKKVCMGKVTVFAFCYYSIQQEFTTSLSLFIGWIFDI